MASVRGTALVTGGRRGIGRGCAIALATAGFDVVIADLERDDDAEATLSAVEERGVHAGYVNLDIGDIEQHERALDDVEAHHGAITCLVNNAGIAPRVRGDLLDLSPQSFDEVLGINLRATFFLSQAVARRMLAVGEGGERPRSIVSVSSRNATAASIEKGDYCISKAGVAMMTKLFALRLATTDIGVFEVRPGIIHTAMTSPPKVYSRHSKFIARGGVPAGRWGQPEDVGKVVAALASGDFAFSTGEAIDVDGGLSIERL